MKTFYKADDRAVSMVQESMTEILKGKNMGNNLPDGCSDKDISDAGEATPATDEEVVAFVQRALPKVTEVNIIDPCWSENEVYVGFLIDRGDIER